jgi:hypothetical protein
MITIFPENLSPTSLDPLNFVSLSIQKKRLSKYHKSVDFLKDLTT